MLCTFTHKNGGALIIRSDDIRAIVDEPGGASVSFLAGDAIATYEITGTAIENRDRIQQEELDLIDRVNQHHLQAQAQAQMQAQMMQQPPRVERGKQNTQ